MSEEDLPREIVVKVLRAVNACTMKHKAETFRDLFAHKLPPEALKVVEVKMDEIHQRDNAIYTELLRRYESAEIDLDEFCRLTLKQAGESGQQWGPELFDVVADAFTAGEREKLL